MNTEISSDYLLATDTSVPFETRLGVLENKISSELKGVRQLGKMATRIKGIRENYKKELQRIIARKKYSNFREYLNKELRSQSDKLLPPKGPEMSSKERELLITRRKEKSLAFLKKLGVKSEKIQAQNRYVKKRLTNMVPSPQKRKGQVVQLVPTKEVPRQFRTGKTNPWTWVTPPFPGWAWNYSGYLSGFSFTPTLYLDSATGLVGNSNALSVSDADDFDGGSVDYYASVGFWYQMPATGLIEVWIEGQSASSHHHLSLWDEWGWSSSGIHQRNYLTFKATGTPTSDELRESEMSFFVRTGYADGTWDEHYLSDGNVYWAHMFSDVPFAKGSWIYIEVGTHNAHYCFFKRCQSRQRNKIQVVH